MREFKHIQVLVIFPVEYADLEDTNPSDGENEKQILFWLVWLATFVIEGAKMIYLMKC